MHRNTEPVERRRLPIIVGFQTVSVNERLETEQLKALANRSPVKTREVLTNWSHLSVVFLINILANQKADYGTCSL